MEDVQVACTHLISGASAVNLVPRPKDRMKLPYLLDQTPLSISHRSRIVAAHPDVLNEIVAALEY